MKIDYKLAMFIFAFVFIACSSFVACSSSEKLGDRITIGAIEKDVIFIGTGGGFTGAYDGYAITRSGDVYSWRSMSDSPDTLVHLFRTTPDTASFYFHYLDESGFANMKSSSGGNMNSFVERRNGDAKMKIHWSLDVGAPAAELTTFVSLLRKYIAGRTNGQK